MNKKRSQMALLLLVPAPSVGVLFSMILFPGTALGATVFSVSKVWILALPVVWRLFVEKKRISLSPARDGGFLVGLLSGCLISALIVVVYILAGDALIDKQFVVARLNAVGLGAPRRFIFAVAYWILVNSVLEEYVWRWFCVKQCEALVRPTTAVLCSGLFFTMHHIIAMQVYLGPLAVLLGTIGIFVGAAIWSAMYMRYRSIWPGYLSHAIVDVAIFGIAAVILF